MLKKYEKAFLLSLYRMMIRIRYCEESFVDPILQGIIKCPVHLYSGEEAIATGVSANLEDKDKVFGNHRSHGHFLAKGGQMEALVAEVFCKEMGCARGRGGSMHLIDPTKGFLGAAPIVSGTISLTMGAALGSKIKKDGSVAVSYFGDGAAGEGVLYESLNFASIHKLPMLFVCENNFYATHMPLRETRSSDSIYESASSLGVKASRHDGNDVLEVYETAKEAIDYCRSGNGPVFLEYETYRLRGHVGPDDNIQGDHTDIRPPSEVAEWCQKDPILSFTNRLIESGIVTKNELSQINKDVDAEVVAAHEFTECSLNTNIQELKSYVFKQKSA